MILIYTLIIIALFGAPLNAQGGVSIRVTTNRDTIALGENLVYSVTVTIPIAAQPAGEPETFFGGFEVSQIKKYEPELHGSLRTEKTDYLITTFQIDTFFIEGIRTRYRLDKDTLTLKGDDKTIIVRSTLDPGDKEIAPEKPIIAGHVRWWLVITYALGALLLIVGTVYYSYRYYKKFKADRLAKEAYVPEIIRTPEEIALENLDRLKAAGLIERGEIKEFHSEASTIIRQYFEHRFMIQALESTTSEVVSALKQGRLIEGSAVTVVRRFLEVCDLVKFAKYAPSPGECRDVLDEAYNIIKLTARPRANAAVQHA